MSQFYFYINFELNFKSRLHLLFFRSTHPLIFSFHYFVNYYYYFFHFICYYYYYYYYYIILYYIFIFLFYDFIFPLSSLFLTLTHPLFLSPPISPRHHMLPSPFFYYYFLFHFISLIPPKNQTRPLFSSSTAHLPSSFLPFLFFFLFPFLSRP